MTMMEKQSDCQTNDPNSTNTLYSMEEDSGLHFPSINVVFTGYYNGYGVEIKSDEEVGLLYQMGCFGKGSASRSRPKAQNDDQPPILRKRQFLKRNQWFHKYAKGQNMSDGDLFLQDIEEFTLGLLKHSKPKKDVIDLVSSEDSTGEATDNQDFNVSDYFRSQDNNHIVIVVPNSESEGDDYFENLKPKSCVNKVIVDEKLMLTAQESFFLLYGMGCLQIVRNNHLLSIDECWELFTEYDVNFVEKYVVYHYFRSKGYIVKPGIKFGGDYLLYKKGPSINHADYIVVIRFNNYGFEWTSILGHVRMANTTVKEVLVTEVVKPDKATLTLPQDLSKFTVHVVLLNRNIPVTINDDID